MKEQIIMIVVVAAVVIALMAFIKLSQADINKITTEDGLECVTAKSLNSFSIDCNYEKHNHMTNFGEFPYSEIIEEAK